MNEHGVDLVNMARGYHGLRNQAGVLRREGYACGAASCDKTADELRHNTLRDYGVDLDLVLDDGHRPSADDLDALLYRSHKLYAAAERRARFVTNIEAGLMVLAVLALLVVVIHAFWA